MYIMSKIGFHNRILTGQTECKMDRWKQQITYLGSKFMTEEGLREITVRHNLLRTKRSRKLWRSIIGYILNESDTYRRKEMLIAL